MRQRRLNILTVIVTLTAGSLCASPDPSRPTKSSATSAAVAASDNVSEYLGRAHELEGSNTVQALSEATQGLSVARAHRAADEELDALLEIGKLKRLLNDYSSVLNIAHEGMALAANSGNERMRGEFYVLCGMAQWNMAVLPEAMASLLEALHIGQTLGDRQVQLGAHDGLGLVFGRNEDHEQSLVHLEAARALAEELHDGRLPTILNQIGNHYLIVKDFPTAREYLEKALALAQGGNDQRLIAYLLINLGEIATTSGDQKLALQELADAMAICQRGQFARGIADVDYLLAAAYRRLGRVDDAIGYLQKSLATAQTLNNPDLYVLIYKEYVATEEARGDYPQAMAYARLLAEQDAVVRNAQSQRVVGELQAHYTVEAHQRKIKLLQRDRDIQQVNIALQVAELSRQQAQISALIAVLALSALVVTALVNRQRARVRAAGKMLAETRAAKEQVEEADAHKAHLLTVAAQDLSVSEARFRSAFEHTALGIALVALDGSWLRVNHALCQIVGYTPAELLATTFQAITHPLDLQADLALLARLLRGEIESYHLEKRYFHKAGRVVWVWLDVSVVRDPENNQPLYFISQVQDTTARKQVEEQLHAAKEEAERANNAKSEFLSRVSHELRTPLNAILGFGQLLEGDVQGPRQAQSVGHILKAGRHLLELIDDVLDISRIESGSFSLSPSLLAVDEAVRGAVELVRPLAVQANVKLLAMTESMDQYRIMADGRRLRQVLLNLLSNAIKYNKSNGTVSVGCLPCEGNRLRIEVRDTGPGIAAEDLHKLFSPFTRLPATENISGIGLGLSVSKVLTEAMGGTLGVSSERGIGSVFWIELPCTDDRPLPLRSFYPRGSYPDPQPATILYLTDDAADAKLVEQLLTDDPKTRLIIANDGAAGLQLACKHCPELILLDLCLPDAPGLDVLSTLRQQPGMASIPVVVIATALTDHEAAKLPVFGVDRILTKPLRTEDIRLAVCEARCSETAHSSDSLRVL